MPMASIPARDKPAAERTGLRRRGAALRPGAAAGCRSLRDRICWRSPRPQSLTAGCSLFCKCSHSSAAAFFCAESVAQRPAGRSLGAAEARNSRPAGPLRARPPQAAARTGYSPIVPQLSYLILNLCPNGRNGQRPLIFDPRMLHFAFLIRTFVRMKFIAA